MKRISLDQMKNMSIDTLIELYRDGYRLEEHIPIKPLSNFHTPNFSNNFSNIHTLQGPLLDPVVNFGKVTVSTGYDATASSITLNTNEGSKLPDPSVGAFNLVWWNSTDYPDPSDDPNKEIVRCTAKTTDTLTVTRPQEGTSASVKNIVGKTYKMILSPTAKTISDISSAITAAGNTTIGSGTYTGLSTVNRAIAHGMGVTPKIVFILSGTGESIRLIGTNISRADIPGNLTETTADGTNFYVGNATDYTRSGNYSSRTYQWVAIG